MLNDRRTGLLQASGPTLTSAGEVSSENSSVEGSTFMVALWIRSKPFPVTLIFRPPLQTRGSRVTGFCPSFFPSLFNGSRPSSPQEAGLGGIICDFGVLAVLVGRRDIFGGVFPVFHRHRHRLRGQLLPTVLSSLAGDHVSEHQAEAERAGLSSGCRGCEFQSKGAGLTLDRELHPH